MLERFSNILILAPHTDDGEFGCGATISKAVKNGSKVYYAAFSTAEESVPPEYPKNILETEVKKATIELGIDPKNLIIHKFPVRHFAHHRQDILEILVTMERELKPDLVLMPTIDDLHQDHSTIAKEGLRAFKKTSILCYELPWNNLTFHTQCFVTFTEEELQKKIQALNCYDSQKFRNYANAEFLKGLAIVRGTQVGTKYAEVFEVVRWIIK